MGHMNCISRQRFAIVANTVAARLGVGSDKTAAAEKRYRNAGMFLDDVECCKQQACGSAC